MKTKLATVIGLALSPMYLNASQFSITAETYYIMVDGDTKCVLNANGNSDGNKVEFELSQLDKETIPLYQNRFSNVMRGNFEQHSDNEDAYPGNWGPGSQSCMLTNTTIDGLGRSRISYSKYTQDRVVGLSSTSTWQTFEGQEGPISDTFIASQMLSLPIAAKISGDRNFLDNLRIVVNNTGLSEAYEKYSDMIYSGKNGFNGNLYGFSIDFLDLKYEEDINEFLAKRSVELAIEYGLINSDVDIYNLANLVRKEVLYLLGQDSSSEYGSQDQIRTSLAMTYSGATSSAWQVNTEAHRELSLEHIKKMSTHFYFSESVTNEAMQKFGIGDVQQVYDYFMFRDKYGADGLDINFAKDILKNINGISVDYLAGTITNTNRYGGYLGKTYITIAEDLYNKKADKLSHEELVSVKTALNLIGIDTSYTYGSLRNIQASILRRVDATLSESSFYSQLLDGSATELLEVLESKSNINFEAKVKDLLMRTYVASGIESLEANGELEALPAKSGLRLHSWNDTLQGNVGDLYVYDNPKTKRLNIFQLKTPTYGYFPTDHSSNTHWQYKGTNNENQYGYLGDFYIYNNPVNGDVEFFRLKGSSSADFPTDKTSNENWEYLSLGEWVQNGRGELGDAYYYLNPHTNDLEMFTLKKSGSYGNFPINKQSNSDWKFIKTLKENAASRPEPIDKPRLYEHMYGEGRYIDIDQDVTYLNDFNDKISSWNIPDGWELRFFENANFSGGYYTRGAGQNNATGFDNRASSVKIMKRPVDTSKPRIFTDTNQQGNSYTITGDVPSLANFNDVMSSWAIPEGWQLRFYEHANYTGGYYTRSSGSANATGFDNKVSSVKVLKSPSVSRSYNGVERTRDALYDELVRINATVQPITYYEKIVDYNEEGVPLYSVPLTDVAYAKAILFEVGLDKAWIDQNITEFMTQANSIKPNLKPWFNNGIPYLISVKFNQILDAYEAETGRKSYKPQDMWSHYYDKMTNDISEYISLNIAFKAKMLGKAPWLQETKINRNVKLHTSYDIVKTRYNSVFWKETESISPNNWVLNGDTLNYSALLGNNILNLFDLQSLTLGEPIPMNIEDDSILFSYLNSSRAKDCLAWSMPPDDLLTDCYSKSVGKTTSSYAEKDAIKSVVQHYLNSQKSEFKTIKTDEIFFQVLKSFLPIWGTIEDIQAGNTGMAVMGVLGDIFFFVPFVDDVADTAKLTVKAIKNGKLSTSASFINTPVALSKGSDALIVGGYVDRAYYAKKAAESVSKIPLRVLDELNPISFGGIDNLFASGLPDFPNVSNVDRFVPDEYFDVQELIGSQYDEVINSLINNGDGTYTINGNLLAIEHDGKYYLVTKGYDGTLYFSDDLGNIKAPIINDGGSWQVDLSKQLDFSDLIGMNTIDADISNLRPNSNGIYEVNGKLAVYVNDELYEVLWDPVYQTYYMFDSDWNRQFISGEYNGKWFVNNKPLVCNF